VFDFLFFYFFFFFFFFLITPNFNTSEEKKIRESVE